ncbi:MAG: cyclase family protein [Rickettsiaceae bacterium]
MTIEEGMVTFPVPWHPLVEITQMGRLNYEQRETKKIILGTHTGTHVDAPRHFIKDGMTVEDILLEQLCGPALLVDFSYLPEFYEITKKDIIDKLNNKKPKKIILRYGWDKKVHTNDYYVSHPFLSTEASQYLVDIGVKLVAQDTPMPDNPKNGKGCPIDSPNHHIFLGNNCILVEYLINLDKISKEEVDLFVLPLKIKGGDGAPARCIVIEN